MHDLDDAPSDTGARQFDKLIVLMRLAEIALPLASFTFIDSDDDWNGQIHKACIASMYGLYIESINRCLSVWSSGCTAFIPLYDALLSALEAAGWIGEASNVLTQMQTLDPESIAKMYIGAAYLKTKGWEAAVDFYRNCPLPGKVRQADHNGARSLRKISEIDSKPTNGLSDLLPGAGEIYGDIKAGVGFKFTIFTVADSKYLLKLAESYLDSIESFIPDAHVHFLLINPSAGSLVFIQKLARRYENISLTWHSVQFIGNVEGNIQSICINARFLLLADLLTIFDRPVLLTDLDFVFQNGASRLGSDLSPFDFVYVSGAQHGSHLPWELVHTNFVYLSNSFAGKSIAQILKQLTSETFSLQIHQTHYDQGYLSSILLNLDRLAIKAEMNSINNVVQDLGQLYLQSSHGRTADEKRYILDISRGLDLGAGNSFYPESPNLALNKPATQSSLSIWSASATLEQEAGIATNGDTVSEAFFHTAEEEGAWWQVDLLAEYDVAEILIFNRRDYASRLNKFKIVGISEDQQVSTELFRKNNDEVFGAHSNTPLQIEIKQPRKVRFLRVELLEKGFLHFREFEAREASY